MDFPVTLERDDNGTILVSFPDFPEAHTFGDTVEDALERAVDALATVIDGYIKDKREIPLPAARLAKRSPDRMISTSSCSPGRTTMVAG